MSRIYYTTHFKKQYKRVCKSTRWKPIFSVSVPIDGVDQPPWHYVINCLLQDLPIPDYFYEHPIVLTKLQQKSLRQRLGSKKLNIKIYGLDLHLDGHNGDHLLLFARTNQEKTYLLGIGTHSELFG